MPRKVVATASAKTKAARAKGKVPPAQGAATRVKREPMARLRTLGAERNVEREPARERNAAEAELAAKALATLRTEFERVFALKDKLAAESKIGATEKGHESRRGDEKLRGLVASLEGMNRFALAMRLISPAESRELYAEAMKRGLYAGWK